ncbi:hydrogenase expression/formation protein HypE [bacterium]|nr:hydrogenase expression/formation protein HypE [bacterium]
MADESWQLHCPIPIPADSDRISLAHGEGGRLMRRLIEEQILPRFRDSGDAVRSPGDAALLPAIDSGLALTTDSFVASPLFFPGGDVGRLAVFGTVNDLVVAGAEPLWLSLSLIIEEGLPVAVLERVLDSAAAAAVEAGVRIVTGDTKVVPRGAADGLFLNTSGVGRILEPAPPGPESLQPGDELIISGPIGRHGIAILAAREQLGLTPSPETDCACLREPARCLRDAAIPVRAMRDATRGGVTAVLHEWAAASGHTLTIDAIAIPTTPDVRGAAELLGLDPLHIANEGTMLIAVPQGTGAAAVAALQGSAISREATVIGRLGQRGVAPVTVVRALGREQPLDEPSGILLPRIC